jgi:hypothetical protein
MRALGSCVLRLGVSLVPLLTASSIAALLYWYSYRDSGPESAGTQLSRDAGHVAQVAAADTRSSARDTLVDGSDFDDMDVRGCDAKFAMLSKTYSMSFSWDVKHCSVFGSDVAALQASPEEASAMAAVLARELALLPQRALAELQGWKVVIVKRMTYCDHDVGGLALDAQRTLALCSRGSSRWKRRTLYHELYHVFEYGAIRKGSRISNLWSRWDQAGVKSGTIASGCVSGYISGHAQISPAEDRAELFATLVVDPQAVRAAEAEDMVIRDKATTLRSEIALWELDLDGKWWRRSEELVRALSESTR